MRKLVVKNLEVCGSARLKIVLKGLSKSDISRVNLPHWLELSIDEFLDLLTSLLEFVEHLLSPLLEVTLSLSMTFFGDFFGDFVDDLLDGSLLESSLKDSNSIAHEVEVSELLDWRLGGQSQGGLILILESLNGDIVGIGVLHP